MRFIGCKSLLLKNIHDVINKHVTEASTFCDIFSGTGTVGRYFKQFQEVYSNDLLFFSYIIQKATIELDFQPTFLKLKDKLGIIDPIDYFNSLDDSELEKLSVSNRFFQNNYIIKASVCQQKALHNVGKKRLKSYILIKILYVY